VLLYLGARRAYTQGPAPWIDLGLGLAAGVALQVNPTAWMAIVVVAGIALGGWRQTPARSAAGFAAGLIVSFAPYLVADAPAFGVVRDLIRDRASHTPDARALLQSLATYPAFASQSAYLRPWRATGAWAPAYSFWLALPVTGLGMCLPSSLRRSLAAAALIVPLGYLVSGRGFEPHYAICLFPLYLVPSGLALGWLWRHGTAGRLAAAAYLSFFVVLGAVLATREYLGRPLVLRLNGCEEGEALGPRPLHHLARLGLGDLEGVPTGETDALLMDVEHDPSRLGLSVAEDVHERVDHELHGGEVVVVKEHPEEPRRLLEATLGDGGSDLSLWPLPRHRHTGGDRSARMAWA